MTDNLHRRIPLTEMADSVQLSPSHLRELFKHETGVPAVRYLRALRMQKAKELLETSFLSVKEIAAKIGIGDVSHFADGFERTYKRTPARHRARYVNQRLRTADQLPRNPRIGG
jgi:transcriptional regulator GlxA family with amidase domain